MIELLTAKEMASLDRETIDEVGIPSMVLMENAADGCTRALIRRWAGDLADGVIIVAGPGNNGGDGYAVARKLANCGVAVEVLLLVDPQKVKGDARVNLDLLAAFGVPLDLLLDEEAVAAASPRLAAAGVLVDALFGTGLERPLTGRFSAMVEAMDASGRPVMAVDIPSGVNATTGEVLGVAPKADLSVTFCRPKRGHFLFPGAERCGDLAVVDIGIPEGRVHGYGAAAHLLGPMVLAPLCAPRPRRSHKGTYGHLLLLAGSRTMPGAAVLAANAALAAGSGLVTLVVPDGVQILLRGLVPEVIVRTLPALDGGFAAESADELEPLLDGKTGVGIGPGVGRSQGTEAFVRRVVAEVALPVVVDADGLRALEGTGSLAGSGSPRVMTPHPGEAAGLLASTSLDVEADRLAAAQQITQRYRAMTVLKGAATVVADPGGELYLNPTGNPGMASAGSGDVLTGLLASLLSQPGVIGDPLHAVLAGVYLHGLAGDLAAARVGEPNLRASDITDAVGEALRAVAEGTARDAYRWV